MRGKWPVLSLVDEGLTMLNAHADSKCLGFHIDAAGIKGFIRIAGAVSAAKDDAVCFERSRPFRVTAVSPFFESR